MNAPNTPVSNFRISLSDVSEPEEDDLEKAEVGGRSEAKGHAETGVASEAGRQSETAGTINLTSDGNTLHFDNSNTNYAQFAKTGGTNSSGNPNNHMQFFCGSTNTSSNVGA